MQKIFTCIFILYASMCSVNANTAADASAFVKKVVEEALAIVNNNSMPDEAKRQKLSECINKYIDIPRITQSVFSPLGFKDLSNDDKSKVQNYLKKYLVRFYASEGKLSAMVNAKLVDEPVTTKENNYFAVTTKFSNGGGGKPTEITWIISDNSMIISDNSIFYVKIEKFNQIMTLRSEMLAAVGDDTLMGYINSQKVKE